MTSPLAPSGGISGSAPPSHFFTQLPDGAKRRDEFLQELASHVRLCSFAAEVARADPVLAAWHETCTRAKPGDDLPASAADQAVLSGFLTGLTR